jgi:tetratricopeptide (TPR) repeat protein
VRLYPRDDIAKENLSSEYFLAGDYDQAAVFAQQALRLDPGSAAWYENLSTAYIALMRLDDAQNILNQALARNLDDSSMTVISMPWRFCAATPRGWNARWHGRSESPVVKMTCWLCKPTRKPTQAMCKRPASCPAAPLSRRKTLSSLNLLPSGRALPHCEKRLLAISMKRAEERRKFWKLLRRATTLRLLWR